VAPGPRDDAQVAQLAHDVWTWGRYQDPVLNWCATHWQAVAALRFPGARAFPLHDATVNPAVNRNDALALLCYFPFPFPFPLSSSHPHPVAAGTPQRCF
jgi:hypothetical protein